MKDPFLLELSIWKATSELGAGIVRKTILKEVKPIQSEDDFFMYDDAVKQANKLIASGDANACQITLKRTIRQPGNSKIIQKYTVAEPTFKYISQTKSAGGWGNNGGPEF